MLTQAAKRTSLAGAFVLTGVFAAGFTYRVMALKADVANHAAPQTYSLISDAQFGTPQDLEKCRQLFSAQPQLFSAQPM